jgi:hypothetical protein
MLPTFPQPPAAAASYLIHFPRYINNLAGTKDRAGQLVTHVADVLE